MDDSVDALWEDRSSSSSRAPRRSSRPTAGKKRPREGPSVVDFFIVSKKYYSIIFKKKLYQFMLPFEPFSMLFEASERSAASGIHSK